MRRDALNIHDQPHQNETKNDDADSDQYRNWRTTITTAAHPLTAHRRRVCRPNAARFWRRLILQIRITIDRDFARCFKDVEVRRNIDIEKFSVNEQEAFRVSEARKLRKIVGLDFGQSRGTNLGQARRFIEREPACDSRILKFLAQTFDCHDGFRRLNSGIEIDQDLTRLGAFAGTQNTALLQNINDPRGAGIAQSQPPLQK